MRKIFTTTLFLLSFAVIAEGRGLSDLVQIKDFKVMSASDEIRVLIKTNPNLSNAPNVKLIRKSLLQMDIEGTYTDPPKRSFTVGDTFLEKVDIYQFDKETVRIRFYLISPFEEELGKVWLNEDGFVLALKREAAATQIIAGGGGAVTIEESFPTIFAHNQKSTYKSEGYSVSDEGILVSQGPVVKMIASLAIVIGIFLVGAYLYKEKILKKGGAGKGKLIKVIDKGYIDVKKGITIVDVAGEILVLGTAGEKVTMLTKLESEEALSRLKGVQRKSERLSFPHAVKLASETQVVNKSGALIDRVRKLKPIV
jgi:flagellar biogenesis protein FliO